MKSLVLLSAALLDSGCASAGPTPASAPAPSAAVTTPSAVAAPSRAASATSATASAPEAIPAKPPAKPAAKPAPPSDIDPTGSYALSLAYGGQPLEVTLQLGKGTDGVLGGSIYADQVPTIVLNTVSVAGKRVQATLTAPDGSAVTLDFTIDGTDVQGKWSASSGDGSPLSGRKLP